MENHTVKIPKALQKDVFFFGLRAKYVDQAFKGSFLSLAMGLVISGILPTLLSMLLSFAVAVLYTGLMLYYSKAYGSNGFIKSRADRSRPDSIKGHVNKKKLLVWRRK
ncbi:DUF4133 domain-containing protein [Croceitalea marina]|uniref:DUF4133 domain-containing protein n=1 Tax=Croceitalea marina TaxID=1775166 RepID=A0ABW5MRV9_9FLAO